MHYRLRRHDLGVVSEDWLRALDKKERTWTEYHGPSRSWPLKPGER